MTKKHYAVAYNNGNTQTYVGSIADYQDGGFADPVLMTLEEAAGLCTELNTFVFTERIGKTDEDNEAAHHAFMKGEWGFSIEEFEGEEMSIYEEIAFIRANKGMTQTELAERCSITQSHVSHIEGGDLDIKVSTLQKIAHELGYRLDLVKM